MSTTNLERTAHATSAHTLGNRGLFRFATAGSVDDGKSTLVGRLLHDAKAVLADTLDALARASAESGFGGGDGTLDLALLTDGLRAEREQGITIDVAYRYFSTGERSFVLADCPGHVQYTRNTVTGASTADAAIVLIDARKGVLEQTRRHLGVIGLLRVPHVIVAVNKIDLIDYDGDRFADIAADVARVAAGLGLPVPHTLPVSALVGDNVVERSAHTPWYTGHTLLGLLESLPTRDEQAGADEAFRFPVQLVLRPQGALAPGLDPEAFRDYRAYAGAITEGSIAVGDPVTIASPGAPRRETTVVGIDAAGRELESAAAPASVALRLADELDIARGDTIAAAGTLPESSADLNAQLCWLATAPLRPGVTVLIKHGTATVRAKVSSIVGALDLEDFGLLPAASLELNDIGTVQLRLAGELPTEPYVRHHRTGAFLVIDPQSGNTLAAGLIGERPATAG
ncbi:sulfate adenylyltransferase subunit 1 [Paeniglutamicibacter kerguelensis]|uniref:sulfate adenylyltransferase n=1 Tax=Paeniglutamicibacter kerguelensis TaxID=254788 RepID=A0ABS4XD39_9MICC|nr:GTP-binding protein [Paeniglutamicibacter kerguelensis]MBP2386389.1 sulfate adenylyltransferase subunit 1 [Paeniglutamicibacter kerguelensis]